MTHDFSDEAETSEANDATAEPKPVDAGGEIDSGSGPPPGIPDKFWDPEAGELRGEALAKSYVELERKLSGMGTEGAAEAPESGQPSQDLSADSSGAGPAYADEVPPAAGDYDIRINDPELTVDAGVNAVLHEAGFTGRQAQLVYELAETRVMPILRQLAGYAESKAAEQALTTHFGGEDRWRAAAKQIDQWGAAKLDPKVYDALAGQPQGVLVMERMMASGEPALLRGGETSAPLSQDQLRVMMQSPKYWRDHDPEYCARIEAGFKALYPGKARS